MIPSGLLPRAFIESSSSMRWKSRSSKTGSRHTAHQAKLSREERLQNLDGAFAVQGTLESPCILLIDDVYTTGSTSVACAQTLMASGAQRVDVLTLAQTVES